ncbi:MAG: AMP-binding protein [Oscillospiraceae bacterium]|nr:AMP-binding protein [Oscillospiraceae bacterium]
MLMYEKYTGRNRDDYKSYDDAVKNFKITYPEDFNFAYDVLDELAKTQPDNLCMLWLSNDKDNEEKRISFAEMSRQSNKAANYFKSLGIKKGDFVMLVLKRSYLFWYCMMGLHKIGAVAVQAAHLLTKDDYIYRCNAGGIKMAVITGDNNCTEAFDGGMSEYETVEIKAVTRHKNAGEGWLDFEAGLEAASEVWERPTGEEATKATDMMIMSFSSGTTGYPKMVAHDFTYPLGHIMTGVFWHRVQKGGLHFTISDTGWLKSLWGKMYGQWLGECAVLTYDYEGGNEIVRFPARRMLEIMAKTGVTSFCAPPTMYRLMMSEDVASFDLSKLKHSCAAGEALSQDLFEKWKSLTGLEIYEGFGQTETTLTCAVLKPFTQPRPGAMGTDVPGYELALLDLEGNPVPVGATGEICMKAKSFDDKPVGMYMGYYKNQEDTEKSWHDNYYHTGDTAYQDEQGYFWFVGRNDDIIKSSGYRIGPFEVESVMLKHPAVFEVAVTGVPDEIRGFNVKATVVLKPDYTPSDELVKELQNFVKKTTAPYKYPRVIEFVDSLPKTVNGKIRRTAIREKDQKATENAK